MLGSTLINKEKFLDLFYSPIIDSHPLTAKSSVSLYILRVDGGSFDYARMYRQLGTAAITYVLSRGQYQKATKETMHETVKHVQKRFRKVEPKNGEGGELILYCFLEAHLNAPKILSKMELKTSNNDYIKGADGLHLLNLNDGKFHLIFGESKLIGDSAKKGSSLTSAISDAFKSMDKVAKGGTLDEIDLVDSNLMKETLDDDLLEKLKAVILPSARDTNITKTNAFGVLLGFEIDTNDWDVMNMSEAQFENKIKADVKIAVESKYKHMLTKIKEYGLEGHHFYIYALPFIKNSTTGIEKVRQDIISEI